MHPTPGQLLARDAADTVRRIRRDVSHMRTLGKLTIAGVRAAAATARAKAGEIINQVGDVIDAAKTTRGTPRGGRF